MPLGSVGQFRHMLSHAVASVSGAQRLPQRWYPAPHVKSHLVPSQLLAAAPVGFGQATHDVGPHESTEPLAAQKPEQS